MEILTSVKRLYICFKSLVNDFVYSFGHAALLLLVEVQNHTVPVRERGRIRVKKCTRNSRTLTPHMAIYRKSTYIDYSIRYRNNERYRRLFFLRGKAAAFLRLVYLTNASLTVDCTKSKVTIILFPRHLQSGTLAICLPSHCDGVLTSRVIGH